MRKYWEIINFVFYLRVTRCYRFGTPYGGITPYAAIQSQSFHTGLHAS
jgi:hypothetical protein